MLVTATDGNHGRAVARVAAHFGVGATVFVPVVMLPEIAARIVDEGAKVVWIDGDYNDAVRCVAAVAVSDEDVLSAMADLVRLGVSSVLSGAATLAGARAALTEPGRRAALDLDDDAVVVLLSREGNTR